MVDTPKQSDHEPTSDHGHGDHGHDNHGGAGQYYAVFGALCVLTLISFLIGRFMMDTPTIAWTGMMAVSCCKAMLVILFFMHLKFEANWKYVLTIPASMMSIFLLLMLIPDIGYRTAKYSRERWIHASDPRETVSEESHEDEDHPHEEDGDHPE